MEREDFPRFAWGSPVRIEIDVEHEEGVGRVEATFQHVLWDSASIRICPIFRLGLITGESVDINVLDRIFERFCVGK